MSTHAKNGDFEPESHSRNIVRGLLKAIRTLGGAIGEPMPARARLSGSIIRWEDDSYNYLEIHCPTAWPDVDITIHGDRIFIQMAKQEENSCMPELVEAERIAVCQSMSQ